MIGLISPFPIGATGSGARKRQENERQEKQKTGPVEAKMYLAGRRQEREFHKTGKVVTRKIRRPSASTKQRP